MNAEILSKGIENLPYTLAHPINGIAVQAQKENWSRVMNYMLDFFETSAMRSEERL